MFRTTILSLAALLGTAAVSVAQGRFPPLPGPQPYPQPLPGPGSPIDGPWFFRGNPFQPCSIQTVPTPAGPQLMVTNEKGTSAMGWLSRDGRRVTIPDWNLTGTLRGNALVWPNGDFWSR